MPFPKTNSVTLPNFGRKTMFPATRHNTQTQLCNQIVSELFREIDMDEETQTNIMELNHINQRIESAIRLQEDCSEVSSASESVLSDS